MGVFIRTTLNIDDLLSQAIELTGVHEKTALLREGLKALIERESAKRLALLGGLSLILKMLREGIYSYSQTLHFCDTGASP